MKIHEKDNANAHERVAFSVFSVPTMCLHCHLIVELERRDTITNMGMDESVWVCPTCAHEYPAKHWRIKTARRQKVPA